jgi:hypothetical protein
VLGHNVQPQFEFTMTIRAIVPPRRPLILHP